jgi:hypothetical protein
MSQLRGLIEGVDNVVKSDVDDEDACMTKWSMSIFDSMKYCVHVCNDVM